MCVHAWQHDTTINNAVMCLREKHFSSGVKYTHFDMATCVIAMHGMCMGIHMQLTFIIYLQITYVQKYVEFSPQL